MKTVLLTMLGVGLLVTADAKDDAKNDQKSIQGKWLLTSGVIDGNEIPKDQVKGHVVYEGNKYKWSAGEEGGSGTFKLDPSKNPKAMDSVPDDGPVKGETVEEIYELDGDNLKICLALPPHKRPTKFAAEAGSGCWLFTYKRAK